jgi:energy-coupling factor transporter ATP-binding protein EcfA2
MALRSCSDPERGLFISVDGPSGAGKSTIVRHLAQMLVAAGEDVHVTAEPSNGPIGKLCRELTETVTGYALACLYAAAPLIDPAARTRTAPCPRGRQPREPRRDGRSQAPAR